MKGAVVATPKAGRAETADPNLNIAVEPVNRGAVPASLTVIDTQRLLWALEALPHGVLEMHQKLKGLVQTSNNVATIVSEPQPERNRMRIVVGCLSRSSMEGRVQTTWSQIAAVGNLARATVESGNSYPGWNPNPESPLLGICQRVYRELFQSEPNVAAIHAGLECGIIGRQMGGDLDMVSFGAKIHGAHSPDERTYPASGQKSYQYLKADLAELPRAQLDFRDTPLPCTFPHAHVPSFLQSGAWEGGERGKVGRWEGTARDGTSVLRAADQRLR